MDYKVLYDRITQLRGHKPKFYLGHSCSYVGHILPGLFPNDDDPTLVDE